MNRKEKGKKFHEALLKMLYPPPPSPPLQKEKDENERINSWGEGIGVNPIPDDLEDAERSSSSAGSDGEGCDASTQKLTRAQRKRLRRKKLKEAASERKKIIGPMPLMPNGGNDGKGDDSVKCPQGVRQNAAVETDTSREVSGEQASCSKQKKLRQRRMAKKLATENLKSSGTETASLQREKE